MKYGMRERVVGGIILVALAVILVPMFFGSPSERASKRAPTVTVNQTPIESTTPQDIVPPTPPQGVQPSAPQATTPAEQQSQNPVSPAEPQPAPVAPASSSYEAAPSKEAASVAPSRDNAMGPVRNAQPAVSKPMAAPSKPAAVARPAEPAARSQAPAQQPTKLASKDPIMAAAGQPRQAAPQAPAKPAAPAPTAPAPLSAPAEGWSVQAGSFGNADNAQRLVQRLSENGFKAYTLKRAGNVVVMVGPFSSSQAGEQARTELQQRASINGFVVRGGKG